MKTEITDFIRLTNEGTRCVYLSDLRGFIQSLRHVDESRLSLRPMFKNRDTVGYYFVSDPQYFDDVLRAIFAHSAKGHITQYGSELLQFDDLAGLIFDLIRSYIEHTFGIQLFI